MKTLKHIGADFHRAMMATAPGEKLLRPPPYVRNWTQLQWQMVTPYDIKLVLCKKIHLFLIKINKNCCYQSSTF